MRTYGKLREAIRKKYGTLGAFSVSMGMNLSTLSAKVNGNSAWRQDEIEKSCHLLGISLTDVYDYFFYE